LSSATTGASDGGSYRSYTPTAVQGIYLDTYKSANGSDETSSGTTGTLLNLKNAGSQKLVLDSNGQLQLPQTSSTGGIKFGTGSTASSVYQSSSNILAVNNSALYARPNGTTLAAANETPALFTSAADNGVGPTKSPFTLNSKGKLEWGAEVAAADSPPATQKDVNLYRNAVGELKTDASLTVAGTVSPANLVVQPVSNSTTSSLFKASDGATVLGIDTTNKVLTTSTQATTSGTALSSNNKLVDKAALTPAYIAPSNVGEWKALRRVVQSPLESGAANAGVSLLPVQLAASSIGTLIAANTSTPTGTVLASWTYVPATVSVQHVRFAYSTALPTDIMDVRVGIWNGSTQANIATSSNLVNSTTSLSSGNSLNSDNSRFQTMSGVTVLTTQGGTSSTLDIAATSGRPAINMTAGSGITGLTAGTSITSVSVISGGYRLTLNTATTVALTSGTALTFLPNKIIDTRKQVTSFNNQPNANLPTANAAFSSAVSLSPGWYLIGVWSGGAATATTPTVVSSAFTTTFIGAPMVDANGPASGTLGFANFKTGSNYWNGISLSSGALPTLPSSSTSATGATTYLDLTA
jgi:hypothetical protein